MFTFRSQWVKSPQIAKASSTPSGCSNSSARSAKRSGARLRHHTSASTSCCANSPTRTSTTSRHELQGRAVGPVRQSRPLGRGRSRHRHDWARGLRSSCRRTGPTNASRSGRASCSSASTIPRVSPRQRCPYAAANASIRATYPPSGCRYVPRTLSLKKADHRKIAFGVAVMNELALLFALERRTASKSRSRCVIFLIKIDMCVKRRRA